MSTDRTASFPPPGTDATQAPAAASLAPGTLIDGTYLVERLLGEGGSGAVHLVRHQALSGARFALKVLRVQRAGAPEALAQEGGYAARVSSAHVVKVIGLGRLADGAPYLVMEYVDGPTLDALLADRELVRSEALSCGRQLCLALEAAHEHGLVHGDVSLRNLFATRGPDGRLHCQLGDFGLARRVRAGAGSTVSFEPQGFRGTPRFLAPEAIGGDGDRDQRSDVFSAGVV
ncbi:MAG: serine/threonine protein kinase, partial [Deltaproteobacteria bacterium]|nr:serine/threonine protein kinase [Deltaproteobacteria bacterium]